MKQANFNNAISIVTGASSGIGRAIALQLAAQKATLVLASHNPDPLEAVAEECRELGGKALAVPADVSNEVECQNLIQRAIAENGRLDLLINNAGIGVSGIFEELSDLSLFRRVMEVNLMGAVYCTYYALPYLRQTRGRIVNISSIGGKIFVPGNTSYCASKSGMIGFSESLRMELHRTGVSVTVICPYWVSTEFHEHILDKDGHAAGEAGRAIYTDKMLTADEFAPFVIKAAWQRRRELMMPPGSLALWLKMIAPGFLDKLTLKLFMEPAMKRLNNKIPSSIKKKNKLL